jgi:hypothetical protein
VVIITLVFISVYTGFNSWPKLIFSSLSVLGILIFLGFVLNGINQRIKLIIETDFQQQENEKKREHEKNLSEKNNAYRIDLQRWSQNR